MPSLSQIRHQRDGSASKPEHTLSSLVQLANNPPERLHRFSTPSEQRIVFYIFRIPGRQELCLSTARPAGETITSIDVSASMYILRSDRDSTDLMTLLRLEPDSGLMEEVATITDPPGQVDVFEEAYAKIESNYWSKKGLTKSTIRSSYGCHVASSQSSLTFTTPWVGSAELVSSRMGNALKCYHTAPHIEGDQPRQKLQVSQLRFNFSMPRMSTSGQVTSKRSSIALQVRNSPAMENINNRRRRMTGSSEDSIAVDSRTRMRSKSGAPPSKDHEFTHPSFYVPQTQQQGQTRIRSRSDLTGYTATNASPGLGQVPEEHLDPYETISQSDASDETDDEHQTSRGVDEPADGAVQDHLLTKTVPSRIMGPRPLPTASKKTQIFGENVETGSVKTGTPIQHANMIEITPQQVEPEGALNETTSATERMSSSDHSYAGRLPGQAQATPSMISVAASLSNSKPPSIKRKPVRSETGDSMDSPLSPTIGKENLPIGLMSLNKPAQAQTLPRKLTIPRRPVSNLSSPDHSNQPTVEEHFVKPPLPPRPSQLEPQLAPETSNPGQLDLALGREKLGGGFDGEQAKLGKLIIEPEGQKMLDLIVATNLLAFRRAFAAADVMGRR